MTTTTIQTIIGQGDHQTGRQGDNRTGRQADEETRPFQLPVNAAQLDFIDRLRARHDNVLSREEMAELVLSAEAAVYGEG